MPAPVKLLLIEDDHDDITFLTEALTENNVKFELETLTRGDQITGYLAKNSVLPDLIVMDLNLPKLHGREVLCKIRDNKKFKSVPVIILTTSSLPEDRSFCLNEGADKFVSKPSSPEGFNKLIEIIVQTAAASRQIS